MDEDSIEEVEEEEVDDEMSVDIYEDNLFTSSAWSDFHYFIQTDVPNKISPAI